MNTNIGEASREMIIIHLQEAFKKETLAHAETKERYMQQVRFLLVENAQLQSELESYRSQYLLKV
jgi:hypothetical protein